MQQNHKVGSSKVKNSSKHHNFTNSECSFIWKPLPRNHDETITKPRHSGSVSNNVDSTLFYKSWDHRWYHVSTNLCNFCIIQEDLNNNRTTNATNGRSECSEAFGNATNFSTSWDTLWKRYFTSNGNKRRYLYSFTTFLSYCDNYVFSTFLKKDGSVFTN